MLKMLNDAPLVTLDSHLCIVYYSLYAALYRRACASIAATNKKGGLMKWPISYKGGPISEARSSLSKL